MMAGPRSRPSGNQPLVMDRERRGSTRMNAIGHALGVFVAIGMVALLPMGAAAQDTDSPSPTASAPAQPAFTLVGLGDSVPGALECPPGCRSYVEVYGELASQALQAPVSVRTSPRMTAWTPPGCCPGSSMTTPTAGARRRRPDHADHRQQRRPVGSLDLPRRRCVLRRREGADGAEHRRDPARDRESPGWSTDRHPGHGLLRHGHRNPVTPGQPLLAEKLAAFNAMICEVAEANGAVCVDLVPAFNGPDGTADAGDLLVDDHIHPSKAGQELIAATVDATGYAPLHPVGVPAGPASQRRTGRGVPVAGLRRWCSSRACSCRVAANSGSRRPAWSRGTCASGAATPRVAWR